MFAVHIVARFRFLGVVVGCFNSLDDTINPLITTDKTDGTEMQRQYALIHGGIVINGKHGLATIQFSLCRRIIHGLTTVLHIDGIRTLWRIKIHTGVCMRISINNIAHHSIIISDRWHQRLHQTVQRS